MVEQLSTPNKNRKFHPSFSDKEKMQKTFYAHVVETPKLNFMKILETEPDQEVEPLIPIKRAKRP